MYIHIWDYICSVSISAQVQQVTCCVEASSPKTWSMTVSPSGLPQSSHEHLDMSTCPQTQLQKSGIIGMSEFSQLKWAIPWEFFIESSLNDWMPKTWEPPRRWSKFRSSPRVLSLKYHQAFVKSQLSLWCIMKICIKKWTNVLEMMYITWYHGITLVNPVPLANYWCVPCWGYTLLGVRRLARIREVRIHPSKAAFCQCNGPQ